VKNIHLFYKISYHKSPNVSFIPGKIGRGIRRFSVKRPNLSSVTGVVSGACKSQLQMYSGNRC